MARSNADGAIVALKKVRMDNESEGFDHSDPRNQDLKDVGSQEYNQDEGDRHFDGMPHASPALRHVCSLPSQSYWKNP